MPSFYKLLLCIAFTFALSGSHTFATPVPKSGLELGRSLSNSVAIGADKELVTNVADVTANYVVNVRDLRCSDLDFEIQVLSEISNRHSEFEAEEAALDLLKSQSEELYNKVIEFRNIVKTKLDALAPEAKDFVNMLIEQVNNLRPKSGFEPPSANEVDSVLDSVLEPIIDKYYKALPDEAKESLKTNFPKLDLLLGSDIANPIQSGEDIGEIPIEVLMYYGCL